jgi:thiol-disulfide isomerase/thioredoxin
MAKNAPGSQDPRPLLALAAFAGALLIGALSWYAWKITAEGSAASAPAQQARAPSPPRGPPPAPDIRYNQLVTAPRPVAAPPIELPTADGKRFSLAAARGQVVLVNFWATWCPPCAREMPSMVKLGQELARKYPGKFRMVAVSVDEEPGAVERFFAAAPYRGLPRDVVVALEPGAGDVTRGYYCRGRGACSPDDVKFPETYIVDGEGRIVALVVGDIDWSIPAAKQYLEGLIKG